MSAPNSHRFLSYLTYLFVFYQPTDASPQSFQSVVINLTDRMFQQKTHANYGLSKGPWMVMAQGPDCPTCLATREVVEEFARQVEGKLNVGVLIRDVGKRTLERFEIEAIPAIFLMQNRTYSRYKGSFPPQLVTLKRFTANPGEKKMIPPHEAYSESFEALFTWVNDLVIGCKQFRTREPVKAYVYLASGFSVLCFIVSLIALPAKTVKNRKND